MTHSPNATKDLIVSIVVPVYNRATTIEQFVDATATVLRKHFRNYELILVDDGSEDGTSDIVRGMVSNSQNIRHVVLNRHYGREISVTAGLDRAIGDYVILMEPTFRDPPELIPDLVAKAQDDFDVVYVSRPPEPTKRFLQRAASTLFYRIASMLTDLELDRDASEYRLLSRRIVNSVSKLKEQNRYMKMLFAYVGYKVTSIPFQSSGHPIAPSEYSYRENFKLALDALISFSDKPLRYIAILSVCVSILAFLGSLWVVIDKMMSQHVVEGWASLMVVQLLMFSILFMFLAAISEYISRTLLEVKQRPLYYVREDNGGTKFDVENILDVD